MIKKHRFFTFILLLLVVLSLVGCGKKAATNSESDSTTPALTESEKNQFRASLDFASAKQYDDLQGVPLYLGSTEVDNSRTLNGNVLSAAFNIMAQPDEFTTFYERELPNFGWDIVKKEIEENYIKLEGTKSGRLATIRGEIEDGKISTYKIITD